MDKTYSQLIRIPDFGDRLHYLAEGCLQHDGFAEQRFLNQAFYSSPQWRQIRSFVITRDNCCDLAHPDFPIDERPIIHHMKTLTIQDFELCTDYLLNPEFLICVSRETHDNIHRGVWSRRDSIPLVERRPNDTCPWK